MKSFLSSFLAALLAIVVGFVVIFAIGAGIGASMGSDKPDIEDGSWLVIDLYGGITEYDPPSNIMGDLIGGKGETLTRVLCNLNKVCHDDRIEGVVFKMSSILFGTSCSFRYFCSERPSIEPSIMRQSIPSGGFSVIRLKRPPFRPCPLKSPE